jgi:hypothetical protein
VVYLNRSKFTPFIALNLGFMIMLITYSFAWSGLYPSLTYDLIFFLLFFFLINFILHFYLKKMVTAKIDGCVEGIDKNGVFVSLRLFYLIILVFIIEVLYNKGIPLYKMISGEKIDYRDFSFPIIHIFFVTFSAYYSGKCFLSFLSSNNRIYLLMSLSLVFIFVLLLHRSMVVFLFLFLINIFILYKGINFKVLFKLLILSILLLLLFGIAGDLRSSAQIGEAGVFDSSILAEATLANNIFIENQYIASLYWSYLYISSPLANFQNTINLAEFTGFKDLEFFKLLIYEIMPDILTSKIVLISDLPNSESNLKKIIDFLTVGTHFGDSYGFAAWYGVFISFTLLIFSLCFFVVCTPRKNYIIQIAVLNSIMILSVFSNMVVYSSFSFILIYAFLSMRGFK